MASVATESRPRGTGRRPHALVARQARAGRGASSRSCTSPTGLWALEYPWPNELVWNSLAFHLDDFQLWLLTEKGQEDQSIRLHGLRWAFDLGRPPRRVVQPTAALDDVGSARRSRASRSYSRFGGGARRSDHAVRVRHVRPLGTLGREHADAGADARGGRAVAPRRHPTRDRRRPLRPASPGDHAAPRRDADRPRIRLPDARRASSSRSVRPPRSSRR